MPLSQLVVDQVAGIRVKQLTLPVLLIFLGACSTSVENTRSFDPAILVDTKIATVNIRAAHLSGGTGEVISNLKSALLEGLAKRHPTTSKIATIDVTITTAEFSNSTSRFLIGAFAGFDRLHVSVTVREQKTQRVIAGFDVKGEYNPGGFGALATPQSYTAKNVAEAIVEKLYGPG